MKTSRCCLLLALSICAVRAAPEPARQEIVFGADARYPPFEWVEDGELKGFNAELEKAVATNGGAIAVYDASSWPGAVEALRAGEVDVVPMFRSRIREREFTFTAPFYYVHHAIYSLEDTPAVYTLSDLQDKSVGVEELSYAHQKVIKEDLPLRLSLKHNTLAVLRALADGDVEYAILAVPAADELIRRQKLSVKGSDTLLWPAEYGFAVRKDREDLAMWLRESLATTFASGEYEEIYREWEAQLKGQQQGVLARLYEALFVIVPILVLTLLAVAWAWSLRRMVNARTFDLRNELLLRSEAEEATQYAASHNTRTRLPHSYHFMALVDERIQEGNATYGELCVFKLADVSRISQTFGHGVAEKCLQLFAARVRSAGYAAAGDFGRGVFAIFANQQPTDGWVDSLSREIKVDDLVFHPDIVAGSSCWPADGGTAHALINAAETAMASALARGAEWVRYEPSMEPDTTDLKIIGDFRKSGATDFFIVLQPQVESRSGRVCAAEALVRWNHPEFGQIPPARFIPLLENAGLIGLVTSYVVRESIRIAVRLRKAGLGVPISINVSALDFGGEALVDIIRLELEKQGCPGKAVKVELTETSVVKDPERVRRALLELAQLDVHASIDDFGTGYSSLTYLSSYPIKEIKIDKEFVHGMAAGSRKLSIVQSTIALAKQLGMTTVAEGAEDNETIDLLRDLGCDKIQGFGIAPPLPEEGLRAFLQQHATSGQD